MDLFTPEIQAIINRILQNGNAVIIDTSKDGITVSELSRKKRIEINTKACPSGGK